MLALEGSEEGELGRLCTLLEPASRGENPKGQSGCGDTREEGEELMFWGLEEGTGGKLGQFLAGA